LRIDETADGAPEAEHNVIEPVLSSKEYRRRWPALIQKIWKSDPLLCPQCSGNMKIIGIVNEYETAKKILVHLNLWRVQENTRPPPRVRTEEEYYPDEDRAWESSCYDDTFYEDEVA